MPNWAEGVIKLRGKREDIKKFLKNGLEVENKGAMLAVILGIKDYEKEVIEITEDEYAMQLKTKGDLLIKGTRESAIKGNITWLMDDDVTEDEEEILHIEDFKQAWGVSAEQFARISQEYNIDIKIFAYESGMEFNQEIEIIKGEIIKDIKIEFDDYKWECAFPYIGG